MCQMHSCYLTLTHSKSRNTLESETLFLYVIRVCGNLCRVVVTEPNAARSNDEYNIKAKTKYLCRVRYETTGNKSFCLCALKFPGF